MPRPFYWLVWVTLAFLAVVSALVPSIDFEVFRWLRPIMSSARNGGFVAQPEEIMFWLPQTAQFIDGFTLALFNEISFVAADRIVLLAGLFFGLQAVSMRLFGRDLAPVALLVIFANETGTYLFPHAFLKGHVLGALFGLAAVHLYLTAPPVPSSDWRRVLLGGVMTGAAASVTFHTVFLPVAMAMHVAFLAVRDLVSSESRLRMAVQYLMFALLYFVPALILSSVWIARNLMMTGYATYPYGIYFPRSGSFGASASFYDYVVSHAALAKPFGYAFSSHTAGPFLAVGFGLSLVLWLRRDSGYAGRFFALAAILSAVAFVGSYAISNISPRYYMYWIAILALCAAAPLRGLVSAARPLAPSNIVLGFLFAIGLAGIARYIFFPAIAHVQVAEAAGDFRRVTPQPPSIVAYANALNSRDSSARWATPLILGADYFLDASKVVNYGWPPFPAGLRLLAAQTTEDAYAALQAEQVKYVMYFRIMPTNMYNVYDWDHGAHHAVRIAYGSPHRSSLRQTLAVFQVDAQGVLLRFDSRYLQLHMKSEPHCAYWTETGCLSGEAGKEPHYLFEVRNKPDLSRDWTDVPP